MSFDGLIQRIEDLEKERDALKKWLDFTYCAYCGQEFPLDNNGVVVAAHIASCEKHPMYQIRIERDALKVDNEKMVEVIAKMADYIEKQVIPYMREIKTLAAVTANFLKNEKKEETAFVVGDHVTLSLSGKRWINE